MAQLNIGGPPERTLHLALLAKQEFDALSEDAQAELAALPKRVRSELYNVWRPAGADMDWTFGTKTHVEPLRGISLFELEQALHGKVGDVDKDGLQVPGVRADAVLKVFIKDEHIVVQVLAEHHAVEINSFDRYGNVVDDVTVTVTNTGVELSQKVIPADLFDPVAMAEEIATTLPRRTTDG